MRGSNARLSRDSIDSNGMEMGGVTRDFCTQIGNGFEDVGQGPQAGYRKSSRKSRGGSDGTLTLFVSRSVHLRAWHSGILWETVPAVHSHNRPFPPVERRAMLGYPDLNAGRV